MRNRNFSAIIIGASIIVALAIFGLSQRYSLTAGHELDGLYKVDKLTGQVWFVRGGEEFRVQTRH
jgi:hypothetical protein